MNYHGKVSFTDDDLKRLKRRHLIRASACAHIGGRHFGSVDVLEMGEFRALLARLEAAENMIDHLRLDRTEEAIEALETWRKAAGKEIKPPEPNPEEPQGPR